MYESFAELWRIRRVAHSHNNPLPSATTPPHPTKTRTLALSTRAAFPAKQPRPAEQSRVICRSLESTDPQKHRCIVCRAFRSIYSFVFMCVVSLERSHQPVNLQCAGCSPNFSDSQNFRISITTGPVVRDAIHLLSATHLIRVTHAFHQSKTQTHSHTRTPLQTCKPPPHITQAHRRRRRTDDAPTPTESNAIYLRLGVLHRIIITYIYMHVVCCMRLSLNETRHGHHFE